MQHSTFIFRATLIFSFGLGSTSLANSHRQNDNDEPDPEYVAAPPVPAVAPPKPEEKPYRPEIVAQAAEAGVNQEEQNILEAKWNKIVEAKMAEIVARREEARISNLPDTDPQKKDLLSVQIKHANEKAAFAEAEMEFSITAATLMNRPYLRSDRGEVVLPGGKTAVPLAKTDSALAQRWETSTRTSARNVRFYEDENGRRYGVDLGKRPYNVVVLNP